MYSGVYNNAAQHIIESCLCAMNARHKCAGWAAACYIHYYAVQNVYQCGARKIHVSQSKYSNALAGGILISVMVFLKRRECDSRTVG